MVAVTNTRAMFNRVPVGHFDPKEYIEIDTSEQIDTNTVPLNGGVLLKMLTLSIDPYQKERMRDEEEESYMPAFKLGHPIENFGVGVVLRSETDKFRAGDHLYGLLPFAEYSVITDLSGLKALPTDTGISWSAYVGVAGMPGQTAYFGWKECARAKKGEIAFVSGGAGAVGSFVIQLARQDGMKVIASAGTDEKVEFMKSLGADVAFNYKTTSTEEVLKKEGPIDVFWDNVSGATLDAALANAAAHGRFIECGLSSSYYSTDEFPGIKNIGNIALKRLILQGILVLELLPKYEAEFYQVVPKAVRDGQIKHREHMYRGLEHTGQALIDVLTGKNDGKSVIIVADS